jgi:hypothetical protein
VSLRQMDLWLSWLTVLSSSRAEAQGIEVFGDCIKRRLIVKEASG